MEDDILHEHLAQIIAYRDKHCEGERASGRAVANLLKLSLGFVRLIMSEPTFQRAMGSANTGSGVLLLANRLGRLDPILRDGWPDDFSYADLLSELFAIANGDAPRLLAGEGKQGKFHNAHALLEHKMEAHAWYKVLGNLKLGAPKRQSLIVENYGITIDAFNFWRREANGKLGSDFVRRSLATSVDTKLWDARMQPDPTAWAVEQARSAGTDYQRELRRLRA